MDFTFLLLLMFVLYVLPELFRLGQKKKSPQPQAPKRPDSNSEMLKERSTPVKMHSRMPSETPVVSSLNQPSPAISTTHPHKQWDDVPTVTASDGVWSEKMNQATLINAVMYAEILAAPRAMKPFRPRGDWRNR